MKKLWTIYEVACFTAFHETITSEKAIGKHRGLHNIDVIHTSMSKYFYVTVFIAYCQSFWWFNSNLPRRLLSNLAYVVGGVFWVYLSRRANRTLDKTWEHMHTFKVKQALCFDENDRPLVEKVIAALMVSQGYACEDDGHEAALDAFDVLAKDLVTETMKAALGIFPIPLKHIMIGLFVTDFAVSLDLFSGLIAEAGASDILAWCLLLYWFTISFGILPLFLQTLSWLMSKNKQLGPCCEWMWMLGCSLGSLVLGNVLTEFSRYLLTKISEDRDSGYTFIFVPYSMTMITLPCAIELFQYKASSSLRSGLEERRQSATSSSALVSYTIKSKAALQFRDQQEARQYVCPEADEKSFVSEESEVHVVVADYTNNETSSV
jgi:hypothetical protein